MSTPATEVTDTTTDADSNAATDKHCYPQSDPLQVLSLFERLSATTNSIHLQQIINIYLKTLTNAASVFLVPILPISEEGLLQVIDNKTLDKEIRFAATQADIEAITLHGAFSALSDHVGKEFTDAVSEICGTDTANILVYAIKCPTIGGDSGGDENSSSSAASSASLTPSPTATIRVFVCVANDSTPPAEMYEFYVRDTFRFVLGHLITAFDLYEEKRVRGQCQNLLKVARRLLGKIGDFGQLLRGVMAEAKDLAGAERCSLFLIDKYSGELISKVFDGNEPSNEVRIENGKGIAGHVAKTGKLLNIRNAYSHPLFYNGVDELTGFKTRNILCFPICDEASIIGVAQLCNKLNACHFDKCDEEIATAFSIYCGISIMHAIVHKTVQKAEARHKLSQELLLYHMNVPESEVNCVLQAIVSDEPHDTSDRTSAERNLSSFMFNSRDLSASETIRLSMQIFVNLNLVENFKIPEERLARFLLLVQKGYRAMPYHNWYHAFSVAHFGYALVKTLRLTERGLLTDLECLSLIVACFCHDLDHRGTNNTYQMQSRSPLARLYSSEGSVNERHHLSQAICILNEEHSKILDTLTTDEFKLCIDHLRELILSTDLANHFRIICDLQNLTTENVHENTRLLLSLLMTCCDLSDQIKPWPTTQHVAELVYAEFFTQGDLERQMGFAPKQMMDRRRACVPELQIDFIGTVVRPTFALLCKIFPEIDYLLDIIDGNRQQWELLKVDSPKS